MNTHKCNYMKKSVRAYIYDPQSMRRACYTSYAGKSKRQRRKKEVTEVMDNIDDFIEEALNEIKSGTYEVGEYRHFDLHDKKKKRRISVQPYKHRCIQNVYKDAVEPIVVNQATDDMCAGLPKRGVTAKDKRWSVVNKVRRLMRSSKYTHIWQGDISGFYYNIRNVVVMKLLERKVRDREALRLIRQHIMAQKDLAIGDPISHLIASLVISQLVRYLKSLGATLVNYADDFLVFSDDEHKLKRLAAAAQKFAVTKLRLRFKPYQIRRIDKGPFRFCGYVYYPNGKVFLLSRTKKRYIRTRHKARSQASYNGMLMACNARHLRKKVEQYDNYKKHAKTTNALCRQEDKSRPAYR